MTRLRLGRGDRARRIRQQRMRRRAVGAAMVNHEAAMQAQAPLQDNDAATLPDDGNATKGHSQEENP